MKHSASSRFWSLYQDLPKEVQAIADKSFERLKSDPGHPSLHFKRIGELRSVRIGLQYRAPLNAVVRRLSNAKRAMRKQYYFRLARSGYDAWDVDRLIALSAELPRLRMELTDITELDQPFVLEGSKECPTPHEILEHIKLIEGADLSYPIILSASGRVMDGMHRVMKAARAGMESIEVVKFEHDPEPDFTGVQPDELKY